MADLYNSGKAFRLNATGVYVLGGIDSDAVGTYVVQLYVPSAYSGTITVQARSRVQNTLESGPPTGGATSPPLPPWDNWNYLAGYVNGAVGGQNYQNTALTTDSIIYIPASGLQIGLNCTYTSGTMWASVVGLIGAAA